jgi:hypothetical protein
VSERVRERAPIETIEIVARPAQMDWIVARIGLFLRGKIVFAWIAASAIFFAAWIVARARGLPIAPHVALPFLLSLVCAPIVFVVAGVGSKRARAAMNDGVAMRFDEDGVVVGEERRAWRDVRDVFEIARVVVVIVVVDGAAMHVVPRRAFETIERMRAFRALVAARRPAD